MFKVLMTCLHSGLMKSGRWDSGFSVFESSPVDFNLPKDNFCVQLFILNNVKDDADT